MDIVRLDQKNVEMLAGVAALYATVFQEPPWNETWDPTKAAVIFKKDALRWWVALDRGVVIGFTAGAVATPMIIAEQFKVPLEILDGTPTGYKAEVGVAPSHRRCGLARVLTETLLAYFRENQVNQFVVRTRPGTGNYPWYGRTLTQLYRYSDGRVIFGCPGVPTL